MREPVTAIAIAAFLLTAPPASSNSCCFNHPQFAGFCRVSPGGGESCSSILGYLNNPMASGKTYCGSTNLRGGWASSQCGGITLAGTASLVVPRSASWQVRMDHDFNPSVAASGAEFTAHLTKDLVAGGALIAPAGCVVQGRISTSLDDDGHESQVLHITTIQLQDQWYPVTGGETYAALEDQQSAPVALLPSVDLGSFQTGQLVDLSGTLPLLQAGHVDEAMALTRSLIQARYSEIVGLNMDFNDAEAAAFWPVFDDYRAAMTSANDRWVALFLNYAENGPDLSDDAATVMLDELLAVESDRLRIRKKYTKRFRHAVPSAKVTRFFQLDNKLHAVINAELANEVPLVQ